MLETAFFQPAGLRRRTLRNYAVFSSTGFWGMILLAGFLYSRDNSYSIMTHTFSSLGSFEDQHNPSWWWVFSLALVFWGITAVPPVSFIHSRFRKISSPGARVGFFLLIAGCAGIVIVGLLPYGRVMLFSRVPLNRAHDRAATVTAVLFIAGILWHWGMLSADALKARIRKSRPLLASKSVLGPYILFFSALLPSLYFRTRWMYVYPRLKAAAEAEGALIGSAWKEALGTVYSFSLWQHVCIVALFAFLLWFPLALSWRK